MVPFLILLAECDTDASADGIKFPKNHITPHFICLDPRNAMVPLTKLIILCETKVGASGFT